MKPVCKGNFSSRLEGGMKLETERAGTLLEYLGIELGQNVH